MFSSLRDDIPQKPRKYSAAALGLTVTPDFMVRAPTNWRKAFSLQSIPACCATGKSLKRRFSGIAFTRFCVDRVWNDLDILDKSRRQGSRTLAKVGNGMLVAVPGFADLWTLPAARSQRVPKIIDRPA